MYKIKKTYFSMVAFLVATVMLFNFIGIKTVPVVWASTTNSEEVSIDNLINDADVVTNDDGYTLNAEGCLHMEEDQENDIEAGEYYININATYSISDNYLYVEITLITPSGEVIEEIGSTSVLSNESQEYYNNMEEEEKEEIKSAAISDNNEETTEYDEYVAQGGISVDDLALILDVAIILLSLVMTVASFAVVTWQAAQISNGLVRNILTKLAMRALKGFLASNTLIKFLGRSIMSTLISLFDVVLAYFDMSIGRLIAIGVDKIDGDENGRCFA